VRPAAALLAIPWALAGCSRSPRAWETGAGSSDVSFSLPKRSASARPLPSAIEAASEHERCTAGIEASGEPLRDVTRLALACGGSTGMRRALGQAATGATGNGPIELRLETKKGRCYRAFGSAAPASVELSLSVRTVRGAVVVQDRMQGPLAFLGARAPFCGLEDGEVTIVIEGSQKGRFALEVWEGPDRRGQEEAGARD